MESSVDDSASSTEDGWPVQHLISEEDLIDTLFHTCDSEKTGKVQVSKMIEYLKFSVCGIKQGEPDLDQLQSLLDPEGVNCGVGIEEYRECITKWVKNLRNKNNSLEDIESDSLEHIGKNKSQADSLNNNNNSYGSLEISGVGEKFSSKSEHDVGELLHEIADMKFHNRKLTEENAKLQQLLVAQDDHITGMVAETERFQKKIKELKELSELRQEVQVENEELKIRICKLQEHNKELQNTLNHLEKEKGMLESNCTDLESEFQKSTMEVNKLQRENQELHITIMEQKKLLVQAEVDLAAKDQVFTERLTEMNELQQKLDEVVSLNERLKEEKNGVEMLLNQSQYELFSLEESRTDCPLTNSSVSLERIDNSEMAMASSRFIFGTPISQRDSICMELKDILEINKHLPSPLCEKRPDDYCRFHENYSLVLPPYTSVWELDPSSTNSATEDLSTEIPVLCHSKSVAIRSLESWKKTKYIHEVDSEGESMQSESEKLKRQNSIQAEKYPTSETKTEELEEEFGHMKTKVISEKHSCQELEESAIYRRLIHETDLRDLWRLVQRDIENECIEDQSISSPLSESSEHLKEKVSHEIGILKSRLKKRQAVLGVLKGRPSFLPINVHQSCELGQHREDNTENSSLIEALALDDAQRYCWSIHDSLIQDGTKKSSLANCLHDSSLGIHSVPLHRRNRITYFTSPMAKAHFSLNFDASSSTTSGVIEQGRLGQRLNFGKVQKHDIVSYQCQNCENESPTFHSNECNTTDHDTSLNPGHMDSNDRDIPVEMENINESCDLEGAKLRRRSYTAAIDNETRSVEEVHIARSRSFSFQSAVDGSKIIPTVTHSEPSGSSGGTAGDSHTSENYPGLPTNITENSWCGPRFSSTPLPQHRPSGKFVYFHPQTFEHNSHEKYSSDPSQPKTSIWNSLHDTSQGKEEIDSSTSLSSVRDKKHGKNNSAHTDVNNASGNSFHQKEITRQTSVSFKDFPDDEEDHQDCGLDQRKCEKGTRSEVEQLNKEIKEVSISATDNKQAVGEQRTTMDAASPIEQKGMLNIGLDVVVNREKGPFKQIHPSGSITLMQKDENENDFDLMEEKSTNTVKVISNLSRLRENKLARRREHRKQMKMPQLSELAEGENTSLEENGDINHEMPLITIEGDIVQPASPSDEIVTPSIPNEFLEKLGLLPDSSSKVSLDQLSEQEIESKFTSLALAFKTDKKTLEKRLEIQERTRDLAEENVDKELQGIRDKLDTLNHLCTDPQVRRELSKIRQHLETLQQTAARVSSRAEVYGAVQQEKRFSFAVDVMVTHVENLRRVHEKEHAELEEAKKLLQDSRSLGSTGLDHAGGESMFSRRASSVCLNNLPVRGARRRVSEVALPRVLGGTGSPSLLQPSYSMDTLYLSENKPFFELQHSDSQEDEGNLTLSSECTSSLKDPKTKFQKVVASASMKSAVANTLRQASLDRQSTSSATNSTTVSREHSQDRTQDDASKKDQKNKIAKEEEAFQKGYEQGLRANLGKDLTDLREQQNHINHSLGEVMDTLDNQLTDQNIGANVNPNRKQEKHSKTLKELLIDRVKSKIPQVDLSWKKVRLTLAGFLFVMAIIVVLISLLPISSASMQYRHMDEPPH